MLNNELFVHKSSALFRTAPHFRNSPIDLFYIAICVFSFLSKLDLGEYEVRDPFSP